MRRFKTTFIVLSTILFLSIASIQLHAQTVTIQPKKPESGDTVTITYHPDSPDAAIKSPDSLELMFSHNPLSFAGPDSINMKQTPDGWTVNVPLADGSKFASFYFKSAEKTDKNTNKHQYTFFVYKNGKPVKGAYLLEAQTLKSRYPDASKKELSPMRAGILLKEIALYPDNFEAREC